MAQTAVMTLTEFLVARIAEDEAVARAASDGPWTYAPGGDSDDGVVERAEPHPASVGHGSFNESRFVAMTSYDTLSGTTHNSDSDGAHIARHDPARVLAECKAKQRIVELHAIRIEREWVNPVDGPAYEVNEHYCEVCDWVPDACDTVKALAAIYADHPDYDEAWRL
jgi:hypothetical protein